MGWIHSLCRLTRLGELKRVYHPEEDYRAIFKEAAREYIKLRNEQRGWKSKIKAKYRRWGVHQIDGYSIYGPRRGGYLKQVSERAIRRQLERLYAMLDVAVAAWDDSWRHLQEPLVRSSLRLAADRSPLNGSSQPAAYS